MRELEVKGLTVKCSGLTIVDGVSFKARPGEWLMIVGPNGAGKSTMISAISQGMAYEGSVQFGGRDVKHMKPRELAASMGVLTQSHFVGYSFTVEEVVRLGRYSHSPGLFASAGDDESERVAEALEKTGMTAMRKQSVLTLSGGELQRTFLAQLFAQDPELLILDEPTNHLDLVYQKQVFALISDWIRDTGRTVISVVHDLSLAKAYGTRALLLDKGRLAASGDTADVLAPENLNKVYSMDVYAWMRDMLSQWQ